MWAQWQKQSAHSASQGDHQSHLYQKMELLEEGVCAACSDVELPIALITILLWNVGGAEGEMEQVQPQAQEDQQLNLSERMTNW